MNNGYVDTRECHNCHEVGYLARNCPKGSPAIAGAGTAKEGGSYKKETKNRGDKKEQKLRTNTGSYGNVKKVGALGKTDGQCDGQQHGK
jgi:hypothetical protein